MIFFAEFLFIYFFLWSTAISCSSTPPHLGLLHVGRRPGRSSRCTRRAGMDSSTTCSRAGTDVTLKVRARPPSLTTWPQAAPICTPNGTRPESTWVLPPCLCCVSRHYQPPYRLWHTVPVLPEQSGEALAGVVLCWRSRGSHKDVWRSLGPPPGSVTFLLCKL